MKAQQIKTEISRAIESANAAYIARTPETARKLNKNGVQPDCAHALGTVAQITPAQWETLAGMGIAREMLRAINASPVKVVKRFAQTLAVLGGGDAAKHLKGSARTLFLAVGAVFVAGAKGRDGLQFAVTGKGNENTSDQIALAVARKLQRMGVTSPASFATQYSVCFSANGIAGALGIGQKGKKGELPTLNEEAPMTRAILARIANLTEEEAQSVKGDSEGEAGE